MFDNAALLATVAVVWVLIGLTLSIFMGRRGHSAMVWLVLGTLLGPLGLFLALDSERQDERLQPVSLGADQPPATAPVAGSVSVLVGYDQSPASAGAIDGVVDLLGERLGRLEIATVVPYGNIGSDERWARATLEQVSARHADRIASRVVLHGHPASALRQRAEEAGFDLIVVGGRDSRVGSVTSDLSRQSNVPVLIVPADAPSPRSSFEPSPSVGCQEPGRV